MSKVDCSKEMDGYHADEVKLPNPEQKEMRKRRDSGRTRLKTGLADAGHPLPKEFTSQGSYAMRTMVQDPECDYDIDDGVYFEKDDLKDLNGEFLSPRAARFRVKNALKDDRLAYDAIVKTNCVRQPYPAGYHIDIPVYRICRNKNILGEELVEYQLSSGDDWVKSDAREVTRWFSKSVGDELKSGEVDKSQIRRVCKLTKKMARSRLAWKPKTTSGICITKLVVDHMVKVQEKDDVALRSTWQAIKRELDQSLQISHPVQIGKNLSEPGDKEVEFFRDCLAESLDKLHVLDDVDCDKDAALKAWDDVFNTKYFSKNKKSEKAKSASLLGAAVSSESLGFPNKPVVPNKSSGFA